eukprot:TRINITY_DN28067_c0_g1_i1.p2 TRINITY_DN28067_c0_g1~~TRINITY_DN28067_c0_g1_i1.p2  ORF type:complete len:180 (+),score=41.58 TRINITY_DN28067_c0_g1_i1:94-633(+)
MWAVPPPKPQPIPEYERRRKEKQLTEEEKEKTVERLHEQYLKNRVIKRDQLMKKHCGKPPDPLVRSPTVIEGLVKRHYEDEVQHRAQRREQLHKRYYPTKTEQTIDGPQTQDLVQRMYNEAVKRQEDRIKKATVRHQFQSKCQARCLPLDQLRGTVERLSQPKKSEWTDDEVNKLLGLR